MNTIRYLAFTLSEMEEIGAKCRFGFWERLDSERCVVRFATSFATTREDIEQLAKII